jgi:hypothetical protein
LAKSTFPKLVGDLLRPTVKEYDRKVRTVIGRIFAFAFCAAFVVIGIGIMGLKMLPVLTCRYVEPRQVDCLLEERIAWLIPIQRTRVIGLQRAYVNLETVVVEDKSGNQSNVYYDRVILVSSSGEIGLQKMDSMGSLAQVTSRRLNAYLSTYTHAPLTVWGYGLWEHTLAAMGGGVFVILFGFVLVTVILSSSLLVVGWIVDFVLVVIGWSAGTLGCDPEIKDRMLRLRSVLKGIVTRPDN